MDLSSLIQRSTLLTAADKSYWMQMLPVMDSDKKAKLEAILTQAEAINVEKDIHTFYAHAR